MYIIEDFDGYMLEILQIYLRVIEYLEIEVCFEKWSWCYFPGPRYNIMMTNMVELLNIMLVNQREFPYVALLDVNQEKKCPSGGTIDGL